MSVPEVIAYLDVLENKLERLKGEVREVRHLLFETLDDDPEALVD